MEGKQQKKEEGQTIQDTPYEKEKRELMAKYLRLRQRVADAMRDDNKIDKEIKM